MYFNFITLIKSRLLCSMSLWPTHTNFYLESGPNPQKKALKTIINWYVYVTCIHFPLISFISHIAIIISFKILEHFESPINSVFNAIFPLFKVLHFSDLNHHLGLPFLQFFWFLHSVFFVYVIYSLTLLQYILWKLSENGYRGGTEFESFQATNISSFHSHLVRS